MPFREASRALLRATVVDAMRRLLEQRLWADITMTEVAAEAGVSRQTLYKEFGDRQGLVLAYAERATERFLGDVATTVQAHRDDIDAALLATFETFLQVVHDDPLVRAIEQKSGLAGLAAFITDEVGAIVVETATRELTEIVERTWPALPTPQVALAAESIVRLALSHMLIPTVTPTEAADRVRTTMTPYVLSLLTAF